MSDELEGGRREPRTGAQAEAYRTADPRSIVEEDGVVMAGPGGAPLDETDIEDRRAESARRRQAAVHDPPPPRH